MHIRSYLHTGGRFRRVLNGDNVFILFLRSTHFVYLFRPDARIKLIKKKLPEKTVNRPSPHKKTSVVHKLCSQGVDGVDIPGPDEVFYPPVVAHTSIGVKRTSQHVRLNDIGCPEGSLRSRVQRL